MAKTNSSWRIALAGAAALASALGIGRFALTPILPGMQDAAGIGDATAGLIAGANNLGYMIGALAALAVPARMRPASLRLCLVLGAVCALAMALAANWYLWAGFRFIAGLASAGAMVFGASLVIDALRRTGRPNLIGVHFGGVGIGIALTGAFVWALSSVGDWRIEWLTLGAVALLAALYDWRGIAGDDAGAGPHAATAQHFARRRFAFLTVAYFCEGLGYSVTVTFIVVWLKRLLPGPDGLLAWIVLGLAAAASPILWSLAGARWSAQRALLAAYLLQAIGIVLPLAGTLPATLIGAVLFGGTFVAITGLALSAGAGLLPPVRSAAVLTFAFGVGQTLGPIAAGYAATVSGGFALPLIGAAGFVLLGAASLLPFVLSGPARPASPTSN
ncbi:MAG: YbfB/YjiJ family MFS transporter [Alphaproteobacteria bacterium]